MKLDVTASVVDVRLSRRNILSLLHKLDKVGSSRTLVKYDPNGTCLMVRAEEDDAHYGAVQPGEMTPDTEAFIDEHRRS